MQDNAQYQQSLEERVSELHVARQALREAFEGYKPITTAGEERRDLLSLEMRHGDLQLSNVDMEIQVGRRTEQSVVSGVATTVSQSLSLSLSLSLSPKMLRFCWFFS